MLVEKKSANATNKTMIAVLCEREGPRSWNNFLPWTSATATSAMTNKRTAWLRAPIMERRVKPTIFTRRPRPRRPSSRMTERRESVGAFSVLDGRVEMYGFFTGPVSAAGDDPRARSAADAIVVGGTTEPALVQPGWTPSSVSPA